AKTDNKYILLLFVMNLSRACEEFYKITLNDEDVVNIMNKRFYCVEINVSKNDLIKYNNGYITGKNLATKYFVSKCPKIWFLDPQEQRVNTFAEVSLPSKFKLVLKYVYTGSYEVMGWQDFMNENK
ncbi:unnamed protein product, partial [marine sediment metagenome]